MAQSVERRIGSAEVTGPIPVSSSFEKRGNLENTKMCIRDSQRGCKMEESITLLTKIKQTFDCEGQDVRAYSPLTLASVSYTHLDVYKRQAQRRSLRSKL